MSNAKICVICNADCSNKPRVKDATGRYACKPCQDAADVKAREGAKVAGAAAAAPAVKVMGGRALVGAARGGAQASAGGQTSSRAAASVSDYGDDGALDLSSLVAAERSATAEFAEGIACRGCGVSVPVGTRICTGCGYDFVNKRKPGKVKVVAAEELVLKPGKWKKGNNSMFIRIVSGSGVALGGAALLALGLLFGWNSPEIRQFIAVFAILYGIIAAVLLVLTPFQEDRPVWGIIAIASLFIPFVGIAMLYYVIVVTERHSLRWWWVGSVLVQVVMMLTFARGLTTNLPVAPSPGEEDSEPQTRLVVTSPSLA
jgi:hypothetical protein